MGSAQLAKLQGVLSSLQPLLTGLKRFEANFSTDAKLLLQKCLSSVDATMSATNGFVDAPGILGYLTSGAASETVKAPLTTLQQTLSSMLSGSVPLPRSSKEELSNLKTQLMGLAVPANPEQMQLASKLRRLYKDATERKQDVDVVENQVDDVMRAVLQNVYGTTTLGEQDLPKELQQLEEAAAKAAGTPDGAMLGLALNSLQRLHASQIVVQEEEEEEEAAEEEEEEVAGADEDDDDDDPFFMPLPSAVKMAQESKFKDLAKPLGKDEPKQFMIQMEEEISTPSRDVSTGGAQVGGAQPEAPVLTAQDFEPVSPPQQQPAAAAPQPAAAPAAAAPAAVEAAAAALQAATVADEAPEAAAAAPAAPEAAAAAEPSQQPADAVAAVQPAAPAAAGAAAPPQEEKLQQFVNFLQGDNPGACMFHAQMRLSMEGCRKLANFLSSSSRVRALSLSHNYLGDDGISVVCEGLRNNRSITAIDLPDNNISDRGCVALAAAIATIPTLTQLQLAYNKVGDEGAAALAAYIRRSQSLKKLGLSYNNIGKAGCQALTAAISSNQSLKHLQLLPGNPVEEKDAKALAKALQRNKKFSIRKLLGMND